jgi:hypothetical protein
MNHEFTENRDMMAATEQAIAEDIAYQNECAIASVRPVQVPGSGWNVQADSNGGTVYLTMGAPYTLAQAQIAADSLRREIRQHGADFVLGGMLIGF